VQNKFMLDTDWPLHVIFLPFSSDGKFKTLIYKKRQKINMEVKFESTSTLTSSNKF